LFQNWNRAFALSVRQAISVMQRSCVARGWNTSDMNALWYFSNGEAAMDWNRVEGNWKEVKGKVKEKWAKLTDDDLTAINGQRDQLEGHLQKRYGYAKDQAKKDIDTWFSTLK
jgi:uncharacterized protein YjbJ (UPF0337 family)